MSSRAPTWSIRSRSWSADAGETRITDATGRSIALPARIDRVYAAGPPASVLLLALAPQKLVGWTRAPRPDERAFLPDSVATLPELGRLTGRGNTANVEIVMNAKPDVIVDVGSTSATFATLAERVEQQTGIPYLLFDGTLADTPRLLRELGRAIGAADAAESLARDAAAQLAEVAERVARIPPSARPRVYFARGPNGLTTAPRGSMQAEVLDLARGETLAVLGGNGAGKTTLFRTLLGLLPQQSGSIAVDRIALHSLAPQERARRLAYVPQQHLPAFGFTVQEAVLMGRASQLSLLARPGPRDVAAASEALERLGIANLAARPVTELSGGERQLVLVARALAQAAPALILDEPTASLDFGNRARVLAEIDRLRGTGLAIVFSTHEPDHALAHADRALLLAEGRMLACDDVERALTVANVERLYRVPVRSVELAGARRVFVTAADVRRVSR